MRRIRIAATAAMVFSIASFHGLNAQDIDFDDLLSELSFGESFGATEAPAEDAAPAVDVEPASDWDDATFEADAVEADAPETSVQTDWDDERVEDQPAEVQPTPAPARSAAEPKADAPPSRADARLMAQQEEVRRQAQEVQARKNFDDGMAAYTAGRFEQAAKLLEDANRDLPVRPANEAIREQLRVTLGDAYMNLARDRMDSDITFARRSIDASLRITPENRRAQALEKRISAREKRIAEQVARPRSVTEQPKYAEKYSRIDDLLREGRDLLDARELNDAEMAFERVLQLDEYNIEAMRFLRRIEEMRFDIRTKEREATVAEMMAMVRDTWNPPIRTDVQLPTTQPQTQIDALTSQQRLQRKMESIIIPSIEFRQANITDVVNFLVDASVAGDPDGIGVNIILKLASDGGGASAAPAPRAAAPAADFGGFGFGDDFGAGFDEPAASVPGASSVPAITLNLRRITLLDAVKYITEVADLRFRLEENVVVITPANVVSGRVITRMYPVQPSILDVIVERGEPEQGTRGTGDFIGMGTQISVKRTDVKDFFERAGVPFPVGTSITYNQSISQLIVANTVENLETFERILSRLNVIPNQVEIEARFVEVNQNNLEELGFQWFLTDNWEIAQRNSSGGMFPASSETIIAKADPQGITKGNRFFGTDLTTGAIDPISTVTRSASQTPLGGVMSFASVLTNPELQVVIQALSQKGNADLLSAPRVTTRSGVNAQIQVVTEIIYPTEFEVTEPALQTSNASEGGNNLVTPPTVTPGSFQTRETGVILNVTPTVGPDGYTIDLTLAPEVAELVDWIQYGSSISAGGQSFTFNIPQPVFASRKVTTSIVVWDGQTVVMGGLIREDLVKYEDKVPLLGDIPVLGRLFRSKGEYSQKKNLLIFVTARLVGPDGRPINRADGIPGADAVDATIQ
ncbi:MAG TPA: hypothetical protein PKE26_01445 [Kiritimatiellia bacterium]|nr:hypothetical protein [Kiritimatiellia bacterium]HMO97756.1 hypothetical protein [Kiritimatiellia bacterium]HMP95395.1 hypothetical protein [Kiritimatiellia bacterium]